MVRQAYTLIFAALAVFSTEAHAQQKLEVFLAGARAGNTNVELAALSVREAKLETKQSTRALGPSLELSARYRYNRPTAEFQLSGVAEPVVLTPEHQGDAGATLRVPLFDYRAWSARRMAQSQEDSSEFSLAQTQLETQELVTSQWYSLVAFRESLRGSEANLEATKADAAVTMSLADAGLASKLQVHRAKAEISRAEREVADALLQERLASRELQDTTSVVPDATQAEFPAAITALRRESYWTKGVATLPWVRKAEADSQATLHARSMDHGVLLPSISAIGEFRATNAAGFSNPTSASAGVELRWNFDLSTIGKLRTEDYSSRKARVSARKARRDATTSILRALYQSQASAAAVKAGAEVVAQQAAAVKVARARYSAGTGQQIDVIDARRDLRQAEVDHIRTQTDLAIAQATLMLRSGRSLP